jgi:hypothetical protein
MYGGVTRENSPGVHTDWQPAGKSSNRPVRLKNTTGRIGDRDFRSRVGPTRDCQRVRALRARPVDASANWALAEFQYSAVVCPVSGHLAKRGSEYLDQPEAQAALGVDSTAPRTVDRRCNAIVARNATPILTDNKGKEDCPSNTRILENSSKGDWRANSAFQDDA